MNTISSINPVSVEANKQKFAELFADSKKITVTVEWGTPGFSQIERLHDAEKDFESLINRYNMEVKAIEAGFDNVPMLNFSFGGIAYLMALAYGCEKLEINYLVNALHRFAEMDQASTLKKPEAIHERGLYPLICERILEFQRRFGDIAIGISDNQSPNDVLTSIIATEPVLLACYDEPETVHRVTGMITDSMIEVNRHLRGLINNFCCFSAARYMPNGMHVSDDNAAFLSPGIYRDFALPYINRLSEAFGGIHFHCCMGYQQNLEVMASAKGFQSLDAKPDFNDIDTIINAFRQSPGGVWYYGTGRSAELQAKESNHDMYRKIIDRSEGVCGINFICTGTRDEALKTAEWIKNYADKQGRLCRAG